MSRNPEVSVIIPNYNYAHYLGECMQSVIDQTFTGWEMIVVDDGSTDNSKEVVEGVIKKYPEKRIRYIYKEDGPSGTPAAINLGIKNSKGKYIAWLSSDDAYMPEKLRVQFKYMEENPEVALTYTKVYQMNDEGEIVRECYLEEVDWKQVVFELLKANFINGNTVLIRKKVFERLGLFRENDAEYNNEFPEIWRATEYEKWIEIAMNFKVILIPQYLHKWRFHPENSPYAGLNTEAARLIAKRIVERSKIEDVFPELEDAHQDRTSYVMALVDLSFLCYLKGWPELATRYLKEIDKIKRGFWKTEIKDVSQVEFMEAVLSGIKKYFNLDLRSKIREFSGLGIQEGIFLLQKGDYTEGKEIFEQWHKIVPEDIKINYYLGSCYKKDGRFSEATDKFQRVLSLPTDQEKILYAGAHFHLGDIYQTQGKLKEAKHEFEFCLKINPKHKEAKKRLFA